MGILEEIKKSAEDTAEEVKKGVGSVGAAADNAAGGDVKNWFNDFNKNPLETVFDTYTQVMSGGTIKREGDKFKRGGYLWEGLGELTGANANRKDAMNANDAKNEAVSAQNKARLDELERRKQLDINASVTVGLLRESSAASQSRGLLLGGANDPASDFLGL